MQLVYKCDFCTSTERKKQDMEAHESNCVFNPAMKSCWSCLHRTQEGAPIGGWYNGCAVGVTGDLRETIEDGEIKCKNHKPEKVK